MKSRGANIRTSTLGACPESNPESNAGRFLQARDQHIPGRHAVFRMTTVAHRSLLSTPTNFYTVEICPTANP